MPVSVEPRPVIIMAGFPKQIKKLTELSLELMAAVERAEAELLHVRS